MNRRPSFVRALIASTALVFAAALGGCQTDGIDVAKAQKELSPQMVAEIEAKGMTKDSPILVRLFKEEAELEIWKQTTDGRFALLKTYPICRWSGELGPKVKEGDRQAPEGFYTITPAQMNPRSHYYLSFNMGYPNAFDRAWGRTGSELMIHGDCSSRGCYAMTDEQIGEIYALGREAFFGGQRSFQVQAYPFRMTPKNLARHRNNPNMAFWKMLKVGYDHFEVTHLEPKVNVCEKRYVFDAQPPNSSIANLKFDPRGKCPTYEVNPAIQAAVAEKQQHDAMRFAELVRAGTPVAPIKTYRDGGMNPVFLAKLNPTGTQSPYGDLRPAAVADTTPLGRNVVPPGERQVATAPVDTPVTGTVAANVPVPRPSPRDRQPTDSPSLANRVLNTFGLASTESTPVAPSKVATANPNGSPSLFNRLFSSNEPKAPPPAPPVRQVRAVHPKPAATAATRPKPQPKATPERHDQPAQTVAAKPNPPNNPPASTTLITGAAPIVTATTFESRWSAVKQ